MTRVAGASSNTESRVADVFPIMWVPAHLTHLALHDGSSALDPTELLVVASALALLSRPRSVRLLLLLAGAQVVDWLSAAPFNPDHWTLVAAVNTTLLLTAVFVGANRRLLDAAAPTIRAVLLIGYGAAAFAKWNSGFVDTARSCAVDLADQATAGFVGGQPWLHPVLVAVSLAAESLIFLGLLVPATRPLGARLGITFHGLLSLGPIIAVWDFTAALLALFVLCLPSTQVDNAIHRLRRATRGSPTVALFSRRRWIVFAWLAATTIAAGVDQLPNRQLLVWANFTPYLLVVAFGFLPGLWVAGTAQQVMPSRRVLPAAIPVLLFMVFTVANPFLGLRTTGAFTMFSNLRTEGPGSNHFILKGVHLSDHQFDLFVIESSNADAMTALAEDDQAVTVTTLRQLGMISDGYTITGSMASGDELTWTEQTSEEQLGSMSWFERWLLSFRPVALDGHPRCGN